MYGNVTVFGVVHVHQFHNIISSSNHLHEKRVACLTFSFLLLTPPRFSYPWLTQRTRSRSECYARNEFAYNHRWQRQLASNSMRIGYKKMQCDRQKLVIHLMVKNNLKKKKFR
jgi:hypothetical protein